MAFWQFKSIVTLIMTSLTLAQRIAGLTDKNYFVIKLLNYDEDDYEQIITKVNESTNDYKFHSMDHVAHLVVLPRGNEKTVQRDTRTARQRYVP